MFEQLDRPFVIKLFKTKRGAGLRNYYPVKKPQFNEDIASNVIKQLSRYYARADWLVAKCLDLNKAWSFNAICGLSLLLVLSLAPRGFSPGTPVFPSP